MHIDERTVAMITRGERPDLAQVGWFAARQPGVLGYLEARCGAGSDALAVAVEAAWRLCHTFQSVDGVPPVRLDRRRLDRAQQAIVAAVGPQMDALIGRQPAVFRWLEDELAAPPRPLAAAERARVATALAAVVLALDEASTGREIS
jgi:hypothetical protein